MFRLIGIITVVYLAFYFGIVQLVANALAVGLFWIGAM